MNIDRQKVDYIDKILFGDIKRNIVRPSSKILLKILDNLYSESESIIDSIWNYREVILDAFRDGELYVQEIIDSDHDDFKWDWNDEIIFKDLLLEERIIPAFCIYNNEHGLKLIWTRIDWRHVGVARRFIEEFNIKTVLSAKHGSEEFWEHMNIHVRRKFCKNQSLILLRPFNKK